MTADPLEQAAGRRPVPSALEGPGRLEDVVPSPGAARVPGRLEAGLGQGTKEGADLRCVAAGPGTGLPQDPQAGVRIPLGAGVFEPQRRRLGVGAHLLEHPGGFLHLARFFEQQRRADLPRAAAQSAAEPRRVASVPGVGRRNHLPCGC